MKIVDGNDRRAAECPVCGGVVDEVLNLEHVPVCCNVLYDDRGVAISATRADIALVACTNCGHLFNNAFDENRIEYDAQYENSLHFSPRFQRYAESLARELVKKHALQDKQVVELACGKGDFLALLGREGAQRVVGFDPSYPEDASLDADAGVEVVSACFGPDCGIDGADFVCCRHALEHVANPRVFLNEVKKSLNDDGAAYFEVPNGDYMLARQRIWDVIYEHCGYFTCNSLTEVFRQAGLSVTEIVPRFGEQFLSIEGRVAEGGYEQYDNCEEVEGVMRRAKEFGASFRQQMGHWKQVLRTVKERGERVVVWGAGSKGVTFVNVVAGADVIDCLIDLNPRKQGKYVAGTGHVVRAPSELQSIRPNVVIVMNENYRGEIGEMLRAMDICPTIMCA